VKALLNEGKDKSKEVSLSPEARPFLPLKPSYISVSSLSSPAVSYSIPVVSSSLPLCSLREVFPQATRMHYMIDQQIVTLATINSYAMVDGMELELSDQKFLLPDPCIHYYVTEDTEVVTKEILMDEALKGVRGIRAKMKKVLADVDALEEKVLHLQTQAEAKMNESSMMISNGHINYVATAKEDVFTYKMNDEDEKIHHNYVRECHADLLEECLGDEKESDMKYVLTDVIVNDMNPFEMGGTDENIAVVEKKCLDDITAVEKKCIDDNTTVIEKKCIDDYGFSDGDDDNSEQVLKKVDSIHVAETRAETSLSSRKLDSCSLSSRPRCVRRVMGRT